MNGSMQRQLNVSTQKVVWNKGHIAAKFFSTKTNGSTRKAPLMNASKSLEAGSRIQLPVFPLGTVALPSAIVPLMIFEARYRVLFNTLLYGDESVEEGLVQKESPFVGSRRFGMCYVDKDGRLAAIGTVLEIVDFAHVKDGRIFITNKGCERFRVTEVVKEKPVLICEVEVLPEDDDASEEVTSLAMEVADLMRNVIRLNIKMQNIQATEDQVEPEQLADLNPRQLSFWVAAAFKDIQLFQQKLLEEDSTRTRLLQEKEVLEDTVRFFSAASALKSAFATGGSEEKEKGPETGSVGPD